MANVVADKLTQANQIKEQIRTAANAKNAGIPEGAPFADYPGYLEALPEQVENMPIALDFSGGDMEIIAPDGTVVKSATIQKPANLIPENIAEGVDVAGVVGTLAGGGSSAKIEIVTLPSTSVVNGVNRIAHNLGVIPDVIYYRLGANANLCGAVGFSRAFTTLVGKSYINATNAYKNGSYTVSDYLYNGPMDEQTSAISGFHNVTSTHFSIGTTSRYLSNMYSHEFILIGGLT